jgi:hypothetical protein
MMKVGTIQAIVQMFSIMWISRPLEKVVIEVDIDELVEVVVV